MTTTQDASPLSPAASEAMREAVARGLLIAREMIAAKYGSWSPEHGHIFGGQEVDAVQAIDDAIDLASEIARLTGERDEAEQRVTNLAAALASAHRARGEQEKRADEAHDRRVALEKDRIHPAFSVEVQEHRQQAYEGGWSDGYAEGFAKAAARAEAAEAETARLRAALADLLKNIHVSRYRCCLTGLRLDGNIPAFTRAEAALTSQEKTDG